MLLLLLLCLSVLQQVSGSVIQSEPCTSGFKVFVYELPASVLQRSEDARVKGDYHICKKCIYEQFSLEYIVYDYFVKHCARTMNPAEADFFYLPIIREIDYRIALSNGGQRAPSMIEEALLETLEKNEYTKWVEVFNVTSEYWRKSNGSDHIIVMPAPVTNFRHQTNMRGFFHYMMQLHAPVFLNVEFSKSFVSEYPVCAREKNIVMPYPTIDPDFYAGKLFIPNFPNVARDKLIFYLGGNHGSCVYVRNALTDLSRMKQIAIQRGPRKREEGFQSAVFCPIPIGDSPSSKRMYDVMNYGCIPVVLSDDLVWAYSTEAGGPLDPSTFSIQLPQSTVLKTAEFILSRITSENDPKLARKGANAVSYSAVLMNGGKPLPSGVTVSALLQEIAAEDVLIAQEVAAANVTHSATSRRLFATDTSSADMELLELQHRYLLSDNNDASKPNNKANKANKAAVRAGKAASAANADTPVTSNTLIRLLQKISARDIALLQEGVRNASRYYQFYPMDANMRTDLTPPAVHAYPSGGALQMLGQLLEGKKQRGLSDIHKRCQAERTRPGHKYIGNYPCEKRRRALSGVDPSNNDSKISDIEYDENSCS